MGGHPSARLPQCRRASHVLVTRPIPFHILTAELSSKTLTGSRDTEHIAVVGLLDAIVDHQSRHSCLLLLLWAERVAVVRVPALQQR